MEEFDDLIKGLIGEGKDERYIIREITGADLVDLMGQIAFSKSLGKAFEDVLSANDLLINACEAAAQTSKEQRDRVSERTGINFHQLRIAAIVSFSLIDAIYHACEPEGEEEEHAIFVERIAVVQKDLSEFLDRTRILED